MRRLICLFLVCAAFAQGPKAEYDYSGDGVPPPGLAQTVGSRYINLRTNDFYVCTAAVNANKATTCTWTKVTGAGGGGNPGGVDTNLQYNNAGAFGGFADGTANQLLHGGRTFSSVVASDTDTSIAHTGVDINTSFQVTALHLAGPTLCGAGNYARGIDASGNATGCTAGLGDALVANPLSQFASTTSLQFLGVISNETGSGLVVGNDTPTLLTPTIASFVNATHNHTNAAGGGTLSESALVLTDITTNNATTLAHGLLPKLSGTATQFLTGTGTFAVPAGTGVTSVATTAPITGGTITTTGTIGCATCGVTGTGLGQFASTTSAQLATVLSDETGGAGLAVFNSSPTIITPTIASFSNATHNHTNAAGGGTLTLAGAAFANQGTTTTLLHGNAAGNPAFSAVANADISVTTTVIPNLNASLLLGNSWAAPGTIGGTTPGDGHFAVLDATTSIGVISDGVHAGILSTIGNTTAPSIPSNSFGFIGPNSAAFTSWFIQPTSTAPAATSIPVLAAVSSNVSALTLAGVSGTGSVAFTTSPSFTTPTLGAATATSLATSTNCAAAGTAASPSVASCSAAASGAFSCATNASTATCTINTTAVTANSRIFIQPTSAEGTNLSVTCNTTADTGLTKPRLATKTAATSFVINLGTFSTNPLCFNYWIVD